MLGMAKTTSDSILGVIHAWRRSALSECFSS